ncbi:MAG: oligosaccharide flippase family protein [Hyphomicrobiales bacterium]|nr:oligosaccharide flippase family protein [Hyphomicrobiales bacterium]
MTEVSGAEQSKQRFIFGSAIALLIYATGIGLAFCSQLLIARILGPASFGIYTYVFAWMSVLAYCANLGFKVSMLRFVSRYEAQKAWGLLRGIIRYAERRIGLACILIVLIGALGVLFRKETLLPELSRTFLVGFLLVPVWAYLWLRCSVARALGAVAFALMPERIVRDGVLLASIMLAVFVFDMMLDASNVMSAMVASSLLGLLMATVGARRLMPQEIASARIEFDADAWRQTALPLLLVGALEVLFSRTGVIVLGWFDAIKDVGIFGLAFNLALLALIPRTAIDTLMAPAISRLHAQDQPEQMQKLMIQAAAGSLLAAGCISLFLWIAAEYILSWFGPEYVAGRGVLMVLLVGQLVFASFGSQLNVLAMTGHERTCALILVFSTAVNIALTTLLVGQFGLIGAAWAMAISQFVFCCTLAVNVWRRLNLLPGMYGMLRYLRTA